MERPGEAEQPAAHAVSASCRGERCSVCGRAATHKLGEEIPPDDPDPHRHNLTAYVCCEHFGMVLGPEARRRCGLPAAGPLTGGLPAGLTRGLADAEVEVVSWSAGAGELVLRVRKELGPEVGLLRFVGVGHVSLPPRLTVAGITQAEQGDGGTEVGAGGSVFVFEEAWGASYFVVAESVGYAVEAEPV